MAISKWPLADSAKLVIFYENRQFVGESATSKYIKYICTLKIRVISNNPAD